MPRKRSSSRTSASPKAARTRLTTLGWVGIITTFLVICSSLTAYGVYYDIYGNITQESINTDAFGDRPDKVSGAVNILVLGSDIRTGENAQYGEAEGARPDVIIVAHISPEKGTATLVNLPRDSVVPLPACKKTEDTSGYAAHTGMINEPLNAGGPACQWKTVEQLTGVHIDHFVQIDFTGFKEMVNALGGVRMCVPQPMKDEKAKLDLEAGEQKLNGEQALAYVRARKALGDGSDLSRIDRQQEFMGAMLRQATSSEILTRPSNLYDFLGAVTGSITTDDGFTLDTMANLAVSMREVKMTDVKFVTVPNYYSQVYQGRVEWQQPAADKLFEAVANDTITKEQQKDEDKSGSGGGDSKPDVKPEDVSVGIFNSTGIAGLAGEVSVLLGEKGYQVAETGNALTPPAKSTIFYGSGAKDKAKLLAKELDTVAVEEKPGLGPTLELYMVGADWAGLKNSSSGGSGGGDSESVPDSAITAEQQNACG